jgi:hypothetical protein
LALANEHLVSLDVVCVDLAEVLTRHSDERIEDDEIEYHDVDGNDDLRGDEALLAVEWHHPSAPILMDRVVLPSRVMI